MKELTGDNFREEIVESDVPVLVDFWAPWCVPCKMMTMILEEISAEYDGQMKFCKVNIDEVPMSSIPDDFSIQSIPALALVKDGEIISKSVGAKSKDAIEAFIGEAL